MNGIITMAIGSPSYGRMAINLAMSIKNKSKLPIDLIYTESAFRGVEWGLELFDNKTLMPNTETPSNLAMALKLSLDIYSRFDNTLFLDADTIICPAKSVDEVFMRGVQIAAHCFAVNELGEEPKSKYETWMPYTEIMELFGLPSHTKIPQINTSMLFWSSSVKELFTTAMMVREKIKDSGVKKWRAQIPDEACFNIALALHDYCPQIYLPLYLGGSQSREYITDNYIGMSVMGKPSYKDIETYNHFAKYYAEMNGLIEPLYYEDKIKLRPRKPLLPHKVVNLSTIGGFGEVSNGGIINPAAWKDGDNYKMILRVDENLEGYKGKRDKAKCVPILATYNRNFKFIGAETIKPIDKEIMEDFRVYMDVDTVAGCCSVWNGSKWGQREFYVMDGRLKTIKTHYCEKNEKNWAWFYHNKGLHVYSVEPFVVRDQSLNKVVDIDFRSGWAADGFISCSTFPAKYGNDYLMWVHKKQKDLTYLNSVMVFDGQTLEPKYFIPDHVLGDDMKHPLYISSCIVEDDRILIFGGEGCIEEITNAALKYSTVRIIDRKIFDTVIRQYPIKKATD